jgi:hypothetical protein
MKQSGIVNSKIQFRFTINAYSFRSATLQISRKKLVQIIIIFQLLNQLQLAHQKRFSKVDEEYRVETLCSGSIISAENNVYSSIELLNTIPNRAIRSNKWNS